MIASSAHGLSANAPLVAIAGNLRCDHPEVVSRLFGNRLTVEHEQFFQRPDVISETCRHSRRTLLPFASLRLAATHPSSQCTVRLDKVVDSIVQIDMPVEEVHVF